MGNWFEALRRALVGEKPAPLPFNLYPVEPVALPGPWKHGLALGMHSEPDADERTVAGDLLGRFKYAGQRNAGRVIAKLLAEAIEEEVGGNLPEMVVHVPGRRRFGRFEPTMDLAGALAKELRIRFLPRFLAYRRGVSAQKDLESWGEKRENVRGAFRVRREEFVRGRRVLLIDDVYDSGATLEECHRVLMEAGAREVMVAAVTKTRFR